MSRHLHHAAPVAALLLGVGLAQAGMRPLMADLLVLSAYHLILAGSWNLLAGFAGQYSFAHVGLAGVGAYGVAWLAHGFGLPVWSAFLVVPLGTALVGAGLGLVSLRVRGVQLPLITFAFAGAFAVFLAATSDVTGGSMGMQVPKLFPGFDRSPYLVLAGAFAALFLLAQNLLLDSRLGLLMGAVRDGEEVARGLGVHVFRVKLAAFVLTSGFAGLAGTFYASYVGVLAPSMVGMNEMGMVVAMAVIGGLGHRYGPLVGVALIRSLEHVARGVGAEFTLLIISGVTLLVILFFREGVAVAVVGLIRRLQPRRPRWADARPRATEPEAGLGPKA